MTDDTDRRFQVSTETASDLPKQFFKKSHELVFSQLGLTAREHDMMALFLAKLHRDHWNDYLERRDIHAPRYVFSSDVLKDWFGLDAKQLYPTLRPVAERLSSRKVGIQNDSEQEFDFIPLFARVRYQKGQLTIVPNSELLHAYVDYSAGHAQINHHAFRKLKSEHSKRLFTLLSRFRETGVLHPQSIDALHGLFGLLDEKGGLIKPSYRSNKVFIDRCIRKPIKEMMQCPEVIKELEFHTDSKTGNVGFAPIMQGRKMIAVQFLYRWKTHDQMAEKQAREKLAAEPAPDDPMLTLVREAWQVVMSWPYGGELTDKHDFALRSVELGITKMPEDKPIDATFISRLNTIRSEMLSTENDKE